MLLVWCIQNEKIGTDLLLRHWRILVGLSGRVVLAALLENVGFVALNVKRYFK